MRGTTTDSTRLLSAAGFSQDRGEQSGGDAMKIGAPGTAEIPPVSDYDTPAINVLGAVIDAVAFTNGRKAGPLLESPVAGGEPAYDLDA